LVGAVQRLLSGASDPHNLIINGGGEEGTLRLYCQLGYTGAQ
jgi:hypothetical protein